MIHLDGLQYVTRQFVTCTIRDSTIRDLYRVRFKFFPIEYTELANY